MTAISTAMDQQAARFNTPARRRPRAEQLKGNRTLLRHAVLVSLLGVAALQLAALIAR